MRETNKSSLGRILALIGSEEMFGWDDGMGKMIILIKIGCFISNVDVFCYLRKVVPSYTLVGYEF